MCIEFYSLQSILPFLLVTPPQGCFLLTQRHLFLARKWWSEHHAGKTGPAPTSSVRSALMAENLRSYFLAWSPHLGPVLSIFFMAGFLRLCVPTCSLFSPTALQHSGPSSLVLLGAPWAPLLIIPEGPIWDKPQSLPGEEFPTSPCWEGKDMGEAPSQTY